MESLTYTQRVPVAEQVDVLVVGGGPAGIAAAIAAGRKGASVALVERYGFLGGTATAALVGPFMTSYGNDGREQIVRGVFDELVRRMEAIGGAIHPSKVRAGTPYSSYNVFGHDHVTPFHPEALKAVAVEMCQEAGVKLRLHSWFVDAILKDATVAGAIVLNKSGLQAIRAAVTIDCSADADVAVKAGAPTTKGRAQDGKMQPMSMFFRIGNVDRERVEAYRREHPGEIRPFATLVKAARERGEFDIPRVGISIFQENDGWSWRVNTSRVLGLDGTSAEDLTAAEIEGHRQVAYLMDFFHKHVPGLEQCVLLETAAQIGIRETRRIVGEYVLSLEDLKEGKVFPDTIAFGGFPVDIHDVDGAGGGCVGAIPIADVYSIPYRSLVPLKVEQLLVAGRCLSATHEAAGAVRVMPPAFAMGQAAGTAAALCTREGATPRALSVSKLQRRLLEQDVYLGPIVESPEGPAPR